MRRQSRITDDQKLTILVVSLVVFLIIMWFVIWLLTKDI